MQPDSALNKQLAEAHRIVNAARVAGELFSSLARIRPEIDHRLHVAAKALQEVRAMVEGCPPGDPDAARFFETHTTSGQSFTDDDDQELLTVEQAADRLGWTVERVYQAIYAGKLQRAGAGWAVRIRTEDLRSIPGPA